MVPFLGMELLFSYFPCSWSLIWFKCMQFNFHEKFECELLFIGKWCYRWWWSGTYYCDFRLFFVFFDPYKRLSLVSLWVSLFLGITTSGFSGWWWSNISVWFSLFSRIVFVSIFQFVRVIISNNSFRVSPCPFFILVNTYFNLVALFVRNWIQVWVFPFNVVTSYALSCG